MEENKVLQYQFQFMKHLNLLVLVYIGFVTMCSECGIIRDQNAQTFLNSAGKLPIGYVETFILGIGYYICLLLLLSCRCQNGWQLFGKIFLEIIVGISICNAVHFGYAGVMLLILADGMQYIQNMRRRVFAIILVCAVYLLVDADLISVFYPVVSLQTMWMYFDEQTVVLLSGVLTFLNALNLLCFIYYMIEMILNQMSEKKRILSLNQELAMKNEQLLLYAKELEIATQTKERNRLAREIHDTLGHALTGIITGIDACMMLLDIDPSAAKKQLSVIADVARQGMKDVRRSINALRPDALEKTKLKDAIGQMIEEMEKTSGVQIMFDCETQLNGFPQDEEDAIYRIVQESMTNSVRHGKAANIWITISREYNLLTIRIRDDGCGCKEIQKGFGLHHMQERLQLLGGQLSYSGEDGFMIEAQIPIRWGEEQKNDQNTDS